MELEKKNLENTKKEKQKKNKKTSIIGPGIVLAATGIGSGDLITNTTVGSEFGIMLAWAVIIGVSLKLLLTESVGRFTLATGQTILEGWRSLGKWTMGYFIIYVTLFGLIYGASIASASGIMMYAILPIIPWWAWAIIHSVAGFTLIWFGRYKIFERVITVLIGIMSVTIVGSAIMLIPNLADLPAEALIPAISSDSVYRVLSIVGGIGGTMALAAYGYWIQAKGWNDKSYIPFMRMDATVAYSVTGLFSISLMVISTVFLYGSNVSFEGANGIRDFLQLYGDSFGTAPQIILTIGFWSATVSSLLGSWNGIPYLFADFVRVMKKDYKTGSENTQPITEKNPAYRVYLAWLTFPSMLLLLVNKPVGLILFYAALGSLFLPFLALTLLILLNSKQVGSEFRNKFYHNGLLVFVIVVFLTLGVVKLIG
ncbi:Nramp family divalent metal transporter [Lentibacillus halophilus]|uniref:Nramp family divalent metal transporter n=1 Tax=Lentibacillus halophilus TaxID=295065 RepID=A0ABP3J8C5_9BACI